MRSAPAAPFNMAFNRAQSAMASLPSTMASVSRSGIDALPASRWSRVKATGPSISPEPISSLTASAALVRSWWPSQQMRAGRPVKAMLWALANHCVTRGTSLNISVSNESILVIVASLPEIAIHRNGPMASQNIGRMNRVTKLGISMASSTPARSASLRSQLPYSKTTAPRRLNSSIARTWRARVVRARTTSSSGSSTRSRSASEALSPMGQYPSRGSVVV